MQDERINFLLNEVDNDPKEPFNYYGLALEYSKSDIKQARYFFDKLLSDYPNYLPTYYMAANFYWALEEFDKTKDIFEKGLELCEPGSKNLKELTSSYQNFMEEIYE